MQNEKIFKLSLRKGLKIEKKKKKKKKKQKAAIYCQLLWLINVIENREDI